jgi:hypothetical protein
VNLGYVTASTTECDVMNAPVKIGPMGRPETPVRNYCYTLRNIPEDSFERMEVVQIFGNNLNKSKYYS